MTPILVNSLFVALREIVNFHLGNNFSTFRSGVTAVFVKKIRLTCQKVLPLPTVGAPSASNSPGPRASRMGWIDILTAKVFYCFKNEKV